MSKEILGGEQADKESSPLEKAAKRILEADTGEEILKTLLDNDVRTLLMHPDVRDGWWDQIIHRIKKQKTEKTALERGFDDQKTKYELLQEKHKSLKEDHEVLKTEHKSLEDDNQTLQGRIEALQSQIEEAVPEEKPSRSVEDLTEELREIIKGVPAEDLTREEVKGAPSIENEPKRLVEVAGIMINLAEMMPDKEAFEKLFFKQKGRYRVVNEDEVSRLDWMSKPLCDYPTGTSGTWARDCYTKLAALRAALWERLYGFGLRKIAPKHGYRTDVHDLRFTLDDIMPSQATGKPEMNRTVYKTVKQGFLVENTSDKPDVLKPAVIVVYSLMGEILQGAEVTKVQPTVFVIGEPATVTIEGQNLPAAGMLKVSPVFTKEGKKYRDIYQFLSELKEIGRFKTETLEDKEHSRATATVEVPEMEQGEYHLYLVTPDDRQYTMCPERAIIIKSVPEKEQK